MKISVSDIIEALTDQRADNERMQRQIEVLEEQAFQSRQLVWALAQAQGVKQDEPYLEADVIATAIANARAANAGEVG